MSKKMLSQYETDNATECGTLPEEACLVVVGAGTVAEGTAEAKSSAQAD